ncbi:hypothetical protein BAUCODRAFT_230781 [Baudoinia panamericana UAMH 10762]|uniref:Uncharacterized protein n=1 Tax=Baudoinia panamericana (strain UAMH 10762) TaxID=717646 RepID=M2LGJ4_BAUPA|nr:uncharacterized protein BAUCODRAFT_230781 [Baudoinia panamericana UAMH 10762]EMC93197.1 hypothetical protein BAUCODRAFT_230781 [Baudoinia panamericana UAMH 10762]
MDAAPYSTMPESATVATSQPLPLSCHQRLFSEDQVVGTVNPVSTSMADTSMEDVPLVPCRRKAYLFARCGHAYIAPPCLCCSPTEQQEALASSPSQDLSLDFLLTAFQTLKLKQECPACQIFTLDLKLEFAKQYYEDNLALWGDQDVDTERDLIAYGKESKSYARLTRAIVRDSENVQYCQQVYVRDIQSSRTGR